MTRRVIVGLFACLLLMIQDRNLLLAQDTSSGNQPAPAQTLRWETYRGPANDIKVLRTWQAEPKFKNSQVVLLIVSNADFQTFVQDPNKLVTFLKTNTVFPGTPVSEIAHWASLMSPAYPGDPDQWLLTILHASPCRGSVTSQPFEP